MSGVAGTRALVTGAGGFIGSHLTELLVREGARVRAFVRYNGRNDWGNLELLPEDVLAEVEVVMGNITDPFFVSRSVEGCDVVYHLAALIGIPYSYLAPQDYVATNVTGTLNVLEAVRSRPGTRLVHTSTSETYGTATYTPIDEAHPLQGQSPYSASKIGADKLAESYHRSFGVPVATLRPFNTFGPRQSMRAVIPTIIAQALAGDVVRLGALTPIRDFTYVTDTARAFVAVGESDDAIGRVLNAGNGRGVTIGDVADIVLEMVGGDVAVEAEEERMRPDASEVYELIADTRQIAEHAGWQPEVSLRDGIARTIEFMREHTGRFKPANYTV